MELQDDKPLAAGRIAYDDVAQQSYLLAQVEERQPVLRGIAEYLVANLVVQVVHQPALLDGQNLVEGSRDVEPHGGYVLQALRIVVRQTVYLFLGQIALVGTAEVQLVAILAGLHRTQYGAEATLGILPFRECRQGYLADACQLVEDLLLLHAQLFLVGYLLPLAAAAHPEMAAEGLRAYLTIYMVFHHLCLHERVLLAPHLQVNDIAGYSPRHKDHHIVHSRHGFSLGSIVGDGDVLQYR